jgi:hypothetical protein
MDSDTEEVLYHDGKVHDVAFSALVVHLDAGLPSKRMATATLSQLLVCVLESHGELLRVSVLISSGCPSHDTIENLNTLLFCITSRLYF